MRTQTSPSTLRRGRALAVATLAAGLLLSGCAKDDGAATRDSCGGSSGAGGSSAAGGSSGAACSSDAPASGSGLSSDDVKGTSDDPLVIEAVEGYQQYVTDQVDQLVTDAKVFTDAVRAGDIEAAKAAYPTSRQAWERIEPIAGLIGTTDAAVDSRAAEGVEDTESPEVTGWHQLEYDLWVAGDVSGSKELADDLDDELVKLKDGVADLEITPLAVAKGAQELIEEVADGKITGEEDRYSHTDLWDLAANVDGAEAATELLMPAIEKADGDLAESLGESFTGAHEALAPYQDGEGWASYEDVTESDRTKLKARFSALAEALSEVPGVLELG
jgi:iron uptake system component EfeO